MSGKKFQAFCEQQVNGNFNVMSIPAATLDKPLGKFFKDVCMQKWQTMFQAFKKAYSAISKS